MPTSSLGLFPFFRPFHLLPEKPWGRGCCCAIYFWLLACYCGGSKRSRVRRSAFKGRLFRPTIPPNPSVLVRPNHPDLWKNESNKVWLWGLLKTCSYPLRTYACFLLWPCLLTRMGTPERAEYWEKSCKGILVQGWPGLAYFKTRDLRPARNVMSSSSLAFKKATPFHTPHRFPRPVIRVPCRSREASEERLRTGN